MIVVPRAPAAVETLSRVVDGAGRTLTTWRPTDYVQYPRVSLDAPHGSPHLWRGGLGLQNVQVFFEPTNIMDATFAAQAGRTTDVVVVPSPIASTFEERAHRSAEATRALLDTPNRPFEVYGRIEGTKLGSMMAWIHAYSEADVRPDGFAFPAVSDPEALLQQIVCHAEYFPDRPIYYTRAQGVERWALLSFLEEIVAPFFVGTNRHLAGATAALSYFFPFDPEHQLRVTKDYAPLALPCDCSVCEGRPLELLTADHRVVHNFIQVLRYVRIVSAIQHNRDWFIKWTPKRTQKLIALWDVYREKGYETFVNKTIGGTAVLPDQTQLLDFAELPEIPKCPICGERESSRPYTTGGVTIRVCRDCETFLEHAELVVPAV